jgi:RNA polymerase sigma factor (sigma-70 family)
MRRPLALRASPEQAFESLYERHLCDVYQYTSALLGDAADAEDVTQATFLNAYRAIERGARPRSARAWLHSIALNLCRQRFRQAARRPLQVPLESDLADVEADDQSPTLDDLMRALKQLPFNQRAALVMREFEGRPPREIAQALELSLGAVETLLFRARRSLREQLESDLTCQEAERAMSLQQDGMLARRDRGPLRAHLRACPECARRARRVRAQRGALKSLALLPLPSSLDWATQSPPVAAASVSIATSAPVVGPFAAKLAAGALAASALIGAGYEGVTNAPWLAPSPHRAHHPRMAADRMHPVTGAHSATTLTLTAKHLRPPSPRSRTAPQGRHGPVAAEHRHHKPPRHGPAHTATVRPGHLTPTAAKARNAKLPRAKPPKPTQKPPRPTHTNAIHPTRDQPRDQRRSPKLHSVRTLPGRHSTR